MFLPVSLSVMSPILITLGYNIHQLNSKSCSTNILCCYFSKTHQSISLHGHRFCCTWNWSSFIWQQICGYQYTCYEHITGDLGFLAGWMKLALPPFDIATPDEFWLYNDFMKTHPHGRDSDSVKLATIYKFKSGGRNIFPSYQRCSSINVKGGSATRQSRQQILLCKKKLHCYSLAAAGCMCTASYSRCSHCSSSCFKWIINWASLFCCTASCTTSNKFCWLHSEEGSKMCDVPWPSKQLWRLENRTLLDCQEWGNSKARWWGYSKGKTEKASNQPHGIL